MHSTMSKSCGLATRSYCKCLLTVVSHSLSRVREQGSEQAGEPSAERRGEARECAGNWSMPGLEVQVNGGRTWTGGLRPCNGA